MSVNAITGSGITIEQYSDIWNDLVNGSPGVPGILQIYGAGVNVNQNSPDGQWINNFALTVQDVLQLIVQVYNAKDPDQAIGIDLDTCCSYCGITRMGGTYTQVYIQVTTNTTLNLAGQNTSTPYTIQDGNSNQYQLISSASLINGVNTLLFQAVNVGAVQCLANTVTIQVTVTSGVISVNNSLGATVTGLNQETDAQLKQRRQVSVGTPAQGANSGLTGALYTIPGLLQAVVYENTTSSTNGQGVPGHSIWVVVDGGNEAAVANMIYLYRNMGCGMYGNVTTNVTEPNGTLFPISFSYVGMQNLYINLTVISITGGTIDISLVVNYLVANYNFTIFSPADITTVTALVKAADPTLVVTACSVHIYGSSQLQSVYPSAPNDIFVLAADQITINNQVG